MRDGSQRQGPDYPPGGDSAPGDVVEQRGGRLPSPNWLPSLNRLPSLNWLPRNWRWPRGGAILLAVGLVAGLVAGYTAGDRQAPGSASAPRPAPAPAPASASPSASPALPLTDGGPALIQAIGTCAVQNGRELQLGVQVTNQSTRDMTLSLVRPVLPLGGLKWISQQWAPCSTLPTGQDPAVLTPGASTWFSVTFDVLVRCPGPLPVQFTVVYAQDGRAAATSLPGFPDLGQVPYTGCAEG
jgi:hypothetical protein